MLNNLGTYLIKHIGICCIRLYPYIATDKLLIATCGWIFNAQIYMVYKEIISVSSLIVRRQKNIYIQLPACCKWQTYGNITSCWGDVRTCDNLAFLAFLINNGSRVNTQILDDTFSEGISIFYGFLLCTTHIAVYFVELTIVNIRFIVAQ